MRLASASAGFSTYKDRLDETVDHARRLDQRQRHIVVLANVHQQRVGLFRDGLRQHTARSRTRDTIERYRLGRESGIARRRGLDERRHISYSDVAREREGLRIETRDLLERLAALRCRRVARVRLDRHEANLTMQYQSVAPHEYTRSRSDMRCDASQRHVLRGRGSVGRASAPPRRRVSHPPSS